MTSIQNSNEKNATQVNVYLYLNAFMSLLKVGTYLAYKGHSYLLAMAVALLVVKMNRFVSVQTYYRRCWHDAQHYSHIDTSPRRVFTMIQLDFPSHDTE